jgi:hypothetical protein
MQSLRKTLIKYYSQIEDKEILEEAVSLIKRKKNYFKNYIDKLQADMLVTYWDKGVPNDMRKPYASQVEELINKLTLQLPTLAEKKLQYKKPTLPENFENIAKKAAIRFRITPEEFIRIYQKRVDNLFEVSPSYSGHFTPLFYEILELFLDEEKLTVSQIADKIKPKKAGKTRYADATISWHLYVQEKKLGFIRREADNFYSINPDFIKD